MGLLIFATKGLLILAQISMVLMGTFFFLSSSKERRNMGVAEAQRFVNTLRSTFSSLEVPSCLPADLLSVPLFLHSFRTCLSRGVAVMSKGLLTHCLSCKTADIVTVSWLIASI